jgi:hypothetical protein
MDWLPWAVIIALVVLAICVWLKQPEPPAEPGVHLVMDSNATIVARTYTPIDRDYIAEQDLEIVERRLK